MIIFNTPFRVRHFAKTISDWIRTFYIKENEINNNGKFIFVYFSYKPDYEYLILSLKSLLKSFDTKHIKSINIFIDQKSPFEEWQDEYIKSMDSKISLLEVNHFSWSSRESTIEELKCFYRVTKISNNEDMLVKVDSDILFFSSSKMNKILKSGILAAGDGHYENYKFAQGGLYLIRSVLIKNYLAKMDDKVLDEIIRENGSPAEDRAISKALEKNKTPFQFTRLMLFPSEYGKLRKLSRFNKFDFCAAHFVKDKENMSVFSEKIIEPSRSK